MKMLPESSRAARKGWLPRLFLTCGLVIMALTIAGPPQLRAQSGRGFALPQRPKSGAGVLGGSVGWVDGAVAGFCLDGVTADPSPEGLSLALFPLLA